MRSAVHLRGSQTTQHHMATRWLGVWLTTVGIHGLQPAPHEPLLRWLLSLHERAIAEHEAALEGLSPDQEVIADQILHEVIATQKDTLPSRDQVAIQDGDLLAVRSAEIAAIVWTLAGLDAFSDPADNLLAWRERLRDAAASAAQLISCPRCWPKPAAAEPHRIAAERARSRQSERSLRGAKLGLTGWRP